MGKNFIIALLVLIQGCATLSSKEAAAGCQVADVLSTHYALHHNPDATEQNPIPIPALDIMKLALAAYIEWGMSDEEWNNTWPGIRIFIAAIGCGAAISNVRVGNEKP